MRLALATCLRLPEPDPDAAPLLSALRGRGVDAELLAWDDADSDPACFDACVLRSTWNYIHRLGDFLDWAARAGAATRLANPLPVVRWNADKGYLRDLAARGLPVVPTEFVPRGSSRALSAIRAERGWEEAVIKPQVGAASFATRRFAAAESADGERFLRESAAARDTLVQPYLRSVESYGERALVWIAGELTHSVRKSPRLAGGHEGVSAALAPASDERAFAERALAPFARELLYARVDIARGEGGELLLMELELIEPSLFLIQHPPALARLAEACARLAT